MVGSRLKETANIINSHHNDMYDSSKDLKIIQLGTVNSDITNVWKIYKETIGTDPISVQIFLYFILIDCNLSCVQCIQQFGTSSFQQSSRYSTAVMPPIKACKHRKFLFAEMN